MGMAPTDDAGDADLVVVNTCAFIEEARQESIDTILALDRAAQGRRPPRGHRLHGRALRRRAGRGAARGRPGRRLRRAGQRARRHRRDADPGQRRPRCRRSTCSTCPGRGRPRRGPTSRSPRAATARAGSAPSRRSAGRSAAATSTSILAEVDAARGRARSCSSPRTWRRYGKDRPGELGAGSIVPLVRGGGRAGADRVRLLYLYPSDLTDDADRRDLRHRRAVLRPVAAARQQAAAAAHAPLGRRRPVPAPHRRHPRAASPTPPSARNFIVGYPGETEADHDQLLAFVEEAAARLVRLLRLQPPRRARTPPASTAWSTDALMAERLAELRELQDAITAGRRDALIGATVDGARRRSRASAAATARRRRSTAIVAGRRRSLAVGEFADVRDRRRRSGPTWSPPGAGWWQDRR